MDLASCPGCHEQLAKITWTFLNGSDGEIVGTSGGYHYVKETFRTDPDNHLRYVLVTVNRSDIRGAVPLSRAILRVNRPSCPTCGTSITWVTHHGNRRTDQSVEDGDELIHLRIDTGRFLANLL